MAYSDVTPPTLPSYDSVANPYYLIQFEYAIGAENWETVRFWYGAAPLTWNGSAVTNAVAFSLFTYGTGSPEWTAWGVMAEAGEMALTPGPTTADTYIRIYTNHDILDGTGAVWLAKGTVTPTEEDKEAEIQIRIKSKLAGIIAAWCAPVRQFPKPTAEPVAFLYNGVRLPGLPGSDLPYAYIRDQLGESRPRVVLHFVSKPVKFEFDREYCENNNISTPLTVSADGGNFEYETYLLYMDETDWKISTSRKEATSYRTDMKFLWGNFNFCYYDGEIYLPESDPVPVYE